MERFFRLSLVAMLMASVATCAAAETLAARVACTPSVLELCPAAAASGNREAAKRCLLQKLSLASHRCQAAVRAEPPDTASARPGAGVIQH